MNNKAILWQNKDSFQGNQIIYDMTNDVVRAGAKVKKDGTIDKQQRVHVTISPK